IYRSRTERLLRYMFRVNPCFYCFGFQCILAVLLTISSIEFSRIERENKVLDESKNIIPFVECTYKRIPEFSTLSCAEDDDQNAFISRFHENNSTNSQCIDRVDLVMYKHFIFN
ncbi:hypothetical protein LOAG_14400, partial [Loa loa]